MITKKRNLPTVSAIIATRDRPDDLAEALSTILNQNYLPFEVIIVDDSHLRSAEHAANSFSSEFRSVGSTLKYIQGKNDGLPAARNLGASISKGDAILFIDDDTLLGQNVVIALVTFLHNNSAASGVQPKILPSTKNMRQDRIAEKFQNAVFKALMQSYSEKNKLAVRKSGASVFPEELTEVISAQRLSGCCCCYRRGIIHEQSFDSNLKLWAYMEDLDYSYRVYKKHPGSLYAIPHSKVIHKTSDAARLPTKLVVYMTTTYWFYVFFNDILERSAINLIAFLWALFGNLFLNTSTLILKKKPKHEWWGVMYLVSSYFYALKHLRKIKRKNLDFFNELLNKNKEKRRC